MDDFTARVAKGARVLVLRDHVADARDGVPQRRRRHPEAGLGAVGRGQPAQVPAPVGPRRDVPAGALARVPRQRELGREVDEATCSGT